MLYLTEQWDCPGVVIVMYDVTNQQSFESCSKWLKRVEAQKVSPDICLPGIWELIETTELIVLLTGALVANKLDLEGQRVISKEQGETLANDYSLDYYECSVVSLISATEELLAISNHHGDPI